MKRGLLLTLVSCTAAVLFAAPASADFATPPASSVDTLTASASGGVVTVSGHATFVDVPGQAALDDTGDATIPAGGFDVSGGTISHPVGSQNLVFSFSVADAPPGIGAAPGVLYAWPVSVDGTDAGLWLSAGRLGGVAPNGANPVFTLEQNGSGGFKNVTRLSGTIGGGTVTWTVPMSRLHAQGGSDIGPGSATGFTGTITGVDEGGFCCAAVDDMNEVDDYIVPTSTVQFGIAPAGTDPTTVALTAAGTFANDAQTFTGSLAAPTTAGSYELVAQACYGAGNCALQTADFTV